MQMAICKNILKNRKIQLKLKLCKMKNFFSRELVLEHARNVENRPSHNGGRLCTSLCSQMLGAYSRVELVPSPLA